MQHNRFDIPMQNIQQVKVWDLLIRLFHWLLVSGIAAAYVSAKYRFGELHTIIGYALIALLTLRIFWGIAGSKYARFGSFIFSMRETLDYLRSIPSGSPRHYLGHNPAGALMVFALMGLLALLFLTGLLTLAAIDFDGPFAAIALSVDDQTSYLFHHLHVWLVDVGMVLVGVHILGVISGSFQHKENLIKAMFTGEKDIPASTEFKS